MNQENLSGQQKQTRAKSREKQQSFPQQTCNTAGQVQSLSYNMQQADNQKSILSNIPILSPGNQTQPSDLGMQGRQISQNLMTIQYPQLQSISSQKQNHKNIQSLNPAGNSEQSQLKSEKRQMESNSKSVNMNGIGLKIARQTSQSRQAGIGISNQNELSDQQNIITSAKNQSRTTQYRLTQKENVGNQKQKKEGKPLELQAYQGSNQTKNFDQVIPGQNNNQKRGTTPVRFNQKQVIQNSQNNQNQNKIIPSSAKAVTVKTKSSNIQQIKGLMAAAVASVKQNPNLQNKLANAQQANFGNLHFNANGQLKTLSDNSPQNQDNQNYYIDMLQACYDPNAAKNSSSQSSVSAIKGLISQNNNNFKSYQQYLGGHAQSIDKKYGEGDHMIDKANSEKLKGGKNYQDLGNLSSIQHENQEPGSRKALVGLQVQPDGFVAYPEDQIGSFQADRLCLREDEMALKMFDAYQKGIDEDNEENDNQHNSSDYVNTENENDINGEIFEQAVDFEFIENQDEEDDQGKTFTQNQEQYDHNQVKMTKRANQNQNNKSLKVSRKRSALKSEERRVVSQQDFKTIQQSNSGIGGINNGGTPHQYNPNNLILEYNTNNKHLLSGHLVGSGDEKEIFAKIQKQKYTKGRSKSRSQNKRREVQNNHEYSASQQKRNSRASIGKGKNQCQFPIQSDGPANLVLPVNNSKAYQNKIQRPLSVDRLSTNIEDGFQKSVLHSKQKQNKQLGSGIQSISSTKQSQNQKHLHFAQMQVLSNDQIQINKNGISQGGISAMASFTNSNNLTQPVQKNQFELTEMPNQFHQTNNSLQQANQILIKQILNNQDLRNTNTAMVNEISPTGEMNQQIISLQNDSTQHKYNQSLIQIQKRMNIFEDEIINRIREIQKYTKGLNSVIRKQIIPKQDEHSQLLTNLQTQLENNKQLPSHRHSENKSENKPDNQLSFHFEDEIQKLYQFCEQNAFTQEYKEGVLQNNEALEGIQEKLIEQNQLITMLDEQIGNTDDRIEQLQKIVTGLQEGSPSERVIPNNGVLYEIQQMLDQQAKRINEIEYQSKVGELGEVKAEIEQKLKEIAEQLLRQAEEGEGRDGLILQQNTDITNLFQAHEQILENQRQFKDQFENMDRITQEISEVQNELSEQVNNFGQDFEGQLQQFITRDDHETIIQDKFSQLEELINNKISQADEFTKKMEQLREYFDQRLLLSIETLKQEVQSSLENTANQMNDNFDHIQSLLENQQIDLDALQQEATKQEQQKLNNESIGKNFAEKSEVAQTNQNVKALKQEFDGSLKNLIMEFENMKQARDIGFVEKQLQKLQLEVSQSIVDQQALLRDNVDALNDQFSGFQDQINMVVEKVNQLCETIDPIQQEIQEIGNKNELKLEEFKGKILNDIKFVSQPNEMSATQQFLTYKTELQLLKTNFLQIESAYNQQTNQFTQVQIDFQKFKTQFQEQTFNQKPDLSSDLGFKKDLQLYQEKLQKEIKNEGEKRERQIDEIEIQIKKIYLEQKESLENIKQKMKDNILLSKNELFQDLAQKQEFFQGDILTMKNILSIIQDSQFQQQIDHINSQINKLQKTYNSQAFQRVSVQPLSTSKQEEQIFMQPFKSHRANIPRQQLNDIDFEEEYSQNKSQNEFKPIIKQAPRNNINLSPIAIVNNDKSSNGGTERAHQLLQGYLAKPKVPLINLNGINNEINLNLEMKQDNNNSKNSYSDDQFGSSIITPDIPTKLENTSFIADHNYICQQVMQIIDFDQLVQQQIDIVFSQIRQ